MRGRHVLASVVAIAAIGFGAVPASADHGGNDNDGGHARKVELRDNCDPVTFNAVLGDGACVPHGNGRTTTFAEFGAKLNPTDFGHAKWRIKPRKIEIDAGDTLKVTVRGGEAHTFTEVDEFGPGCVKEINIPLGLGSEISAPCEAFGATFVAPNGGSTLPVIGLTPGMHKFMCEIHPWMRTVVTVEADEHGDD